MSDLRRTKIIATLGPSTDADTVLEAVIRAGADVLRINFSHGSKAQQAARVVQVKRVARAFGREVAVLADLRGPKIRIGAFGQGEVALREGDPFTLDASPGAEAGDRSGVGVSYSGLAADVSPGDLLLLDDGMLSMRVIEVEDDKIRCRVENGGVLGDRKGINLKGGGLSVPGVTDDDLGDIGRAAEMGVDYLAVSFPRNAQDMNTARRQLREAGSKAHLVAKIERAEAIENLDEIIAASDAVLIARGDLGVEIGDADLPGLQKLITRKSLRRHRTVITATQMMQSMVENPVPTRAEVLDVANAVLDGTDAVMLSAETAVGRHPAEAVGAMHRVCVGAERYGDHDPDIGQLQTRFRKIDQAIAMAAMFMAMHVSVRAIVALTESGSTAQWLSRVRSAVPIYALSPNGPSRRRMALYRGVYPVAQAFTGTGPEQVLTAGIGLLREQGRISAGDRIILTMGERTGNEGGTNSLRLVQVAETGVLEEAMAVG